MSGAVTSWEIVVKRPQIVCHPITDTDANSYRRAERLELNAYKSRTFLVFFLCFLFSLCGITSGAGRRTSSWCVFCFTLVSRPFRRSTRMTSVWWVHRTNCGWEFFFSLESESFIIDCPSRIPPPPFFCLLDAAVVSAGYKVVRSCSDVSAANAWPLLIIPLTRLVQPSVALCMGCVV